MKYLAPPYGHPDPEVMKDRIKKIYSVFSEITAKGEKIICPTITNFFLDTFGEAPDRETWRKRCDHLIERSTELVILTLDGWQESPGLRRDIALAESNNIPVTYINY